MKKETVKRALIIIAIPTLYALVIRFFFGVKGWNEVFSMMSKTFLFLLPFIVGALTVYFSKIEKVRKLAYRIVAPWVPIMVFFVFTLLTAIEGWPCLVMILPIFLIAASIGGLLGGFLKIRQQDGKTYLSILTLLPFIIAPLESALGPNLKEYKAYTFIDIEAPADKIWGNVTRVSEIPPAQDSGQITKLLDFPRPVKAELDFEGVGAYREAIFTNGLVFHEAVTEYEHEKKMAFTIKAHPHEIPLTTMDEHLVVGGKYFDVLNGVYELEALGENQ